MAALPISESPDAETRISTSKNEEATAKERDKDKDKDPQKNMQLSAVDLREDDEEYEVRKRLPPRLPVRKNDVYVTRRTNFKAQIGRCQKLLDSGYDSVYIHGLGAAVNRAINLALQLKRRGLGSLEVAVNTSTVEVTDDLEPLLDDAQAKTRVRNCSAVHIKIFRPETPVKDF